MYKVEIKRIKYINNIKYVSTIDTYYFNGENAYEESLKFIKEFNKTMKFYDNGYEIAAKPRICKSYVTNNIILNFLQEIKNTLTNLAPDQSKPTMPKKSNNIHTLRDYFEKV